MNILSRQFDSVMGGMGGIKVPKNHHEVDEWRCMVDPPSPWTTTHYPIPCRKVIYVHVYVFNIAKFQNDQRQIIYFQNLPGPTSLGI